MNMRIKSKFGLQHVFRRNLFFVSLISLLLLVSLFSCTSSVGAVDLVETEVDLKNAISAATDGVSTSIVLGKDIALTSPLSIPDHKNITLTSDGSNTFKLIGADEKNTLVVDAGGILVLNGVRVTHPSGVKGSGVYVASGGSLILVSGSISDNADADGGGVVNYGNFTMSGGQVSSNAATEFVEDVGGGGVLNRGNFIMSGGEISNNNIFNGVYNFGNFTMSGGKILKNIGSGVFNSGNFIMSGGEISNNIADSGGGVYINSSFDDGGSFTMSGGMIYNNSAVDSGGGVHNVGGIFNLSDGIIANNTATTYGGGIYSTGSVVMSGGEISNNTSTVGGGVVNNLGNFTMTNGIFLNNAATSVGGGVYTYGGNFTMSGGKISNCTARHGGGIGVSSLNGLQYVYVNDAAFSNNRASVAYDRSSDHNELYNTRISSSTWTSPFKQGYNNYDIHYTWGIELDADGNPVPTATAKPTNSASNSPSPTNTTPSSSKPTNPPTEPVTNILRIIIVLVIVIGLVVALFVFYIPKRVEPKHAEEDLSDFTIV